MEQNNMLAQYSFFFFNSQCSTGHLLPHKKQVRGWMYILDVTDWLIDWLIDRHPAGMTTKRRFWTFLMRGFTHSRWEVHLSFLFCLVFLHSAAILLGCRNHTRYLPIVTIGTQNRGRFTALSARSSAPHSSGPSAPLSCWWGAKATVAPFNCSHLDLFYHNQSTTNVPQPWLKYNILAKVIVIWMR